MKSSGGKVFLNPASHKHVQCVSGVAGKPNTVHGSQTYTYII